MRVTRTVPLLASAATLAVALAPSSAGAAPYKTPKARGDIIGAPSIKVVGGEEIALTRAAAKRFFRGTLRLACTGVPGELGAGGNSETRSTTLRRRGTTLPIPKELDYCVASLERKSGGATNFFSLGAVAITTEGDDYLYERSAAGIMSQVLSLTVGDEDDEPSTVPEILEQLKDVHVAGRPLTSLATPAPRTQVAADQLGVWTDGTRTSLTATTPAGRRLYLDYDRSTKDLSTNVFPALIDDSLED